MQQRRDLGLQDGAWSTTFAERGGGPQVEQTATALDLGRDVARARRRALAEVTALIARDAAALPQAYLDQTLVPEGGE